MSAQDKKEAPKKVDKKEDKKDTQKKSPASQKSGNPPKKK